MKLAIMQPYFFPYLGYIQLMAAADVFVFYDNVQFIKGGWINRNRILGPGGVQMISLQTQGASANKLINEVGIGQNQTKLLRTVEQSYARAPFADEIMPFIKDCMEFPEQNLSRFLQNSLTALAGLLKLETRFIVASQTGVDMSGSATDKVLAYCQSLGAQVYINAEGGRRLYDVADFAAHDIDLKFLVPTPVAYVQKRADLPFEPNLSIIDVLMSVGIEGTRGLLAGYTLEP